MSEKSHGPIRNGIIASVIAGVILLIIQASSGYVGIFLSWLWSGSLFYWKTLAAPLSLPLWIFLILLLLAISGIVILALRFLPRKGDSEEGEDVIREIKCRWKRSNNRIIGPRCFCPRCDATLVLKRVPIIKHDIHGTPRETSFKTHFICEKCNNKVVASIDGENKYAIGLLKREIERRIRTGEYKKQ